MFRSLGGDGLARELAWGGVGGVVVLSWRSVSAGTAAVGGDPWRVGVRQRRGGCLGESPGILKDVP